MNPSKSASLLRLLPTLAALALVGSALLAPATAPAQGREVRRPVLEEGPFDNLHTCFSTYALCISAPCTPIPEFADSDKDSFASKQALCECEVVTGYNIGAGDCETRAQTQSQKGYLISTYSVAQTEAKGLLECNGPAEYADCFNFPCQIDENDPARAHCTCPILPGRTGYITRGGDCDQDNCSRLWSAAPARANLAINQLIWSQLGFTQNPPAGFGRVPPENLCAVGGE